MHAYTSLPEGIQPIEESEFLTVKDPNPTRQSRQESRQPCASHRACVGWERFTGTHRVGRRLLRVLP
jgi:hypothetical protein